MNQHVNIHDHYTFPLIGLAPMDGVSDTAFRQITKKYGNPDIMFTEFTHVRALTEAAQNVLREFEFAEMERPVWAQIYGAEPEYFYHAAKIVCALGFDGVDTNMGCPAKSVASSGAGAALINTPDIALEIIKEVKRGVADWVADGKLTGLRKKPQEAVENMIERNRLRVASDEFREVNPLPATRNSKLSLGQINLSGDKRVELPVTVKTRIGFKEPVTEQWVKTLTKAKPDWIAIHGRTLKQMYTGGADWDELKKAVDATDIPVLTNGDVKEHEDIQRMLKHTGSAGVLIGRGAFGNPFVFKNTKTLKTKIQHTEAAYDFIKSIMLEHAKLHVATKPDPRAFVQLRKHFGWYAKTLQSWYNELGTPTAAAGKYENIKALKMELVRVSGLEELARIVKK